MEGISFRLACLIVYKGTTFQKGSYAHYVTLCHILSFLSSFLFFLKKNFIFAVENYRNYSGSPRKCDISATSLGV